VSNFRSDVRLALVVFRIFPDMNRLARMYGLLSRSTNRMKAESEVDVLTVFRQNWKHESFVKEAAL
jgi:hypothetical protein